MTLLLTTLSRNEEYIMNGYDFDKTIYDGDCTRDFYWYALKHQPRILKHIPYQGIQFLRYILCRKEKTWFKERFYVLFQSLKDTEQLIQSFWDEHEHLIKTWYLSQQQQDDIIISASPDFLVRPMCHRLGIQFIIASKVDIHTGEYNGKNCYGKEKVTRLHQEIGHVTFDSFYSDSRSDTPLAELADRAFLVHKNECTPWI